MSTARPAPRCALSTHFIRPSRHRLNIPDMDLDTWNAPQPCPRSRSAGQRCIEQIAALLEGPGRRRSDPRGGTVAALPHALQCAQLAEWAHAEVELIGAALLHDLGHLLGSLGGPAPAGLDHAGQAARWLSQHWDDGLTEPVRLHSLAKRYLVGFDPRYGEALSTPSLHSLAVQGGPMTPLEMRRFEALPHAGAAIKLRIWDDMAHHPGKSTPPLQHYLDLLERLLPTEPPRRSHLPIALQTSA